MKDKVFVILILFALTAPVEARAGDWVSAGVAKSSDRLLSESSAYSDITLRSMTLDLRGNKNLDFLGVGKLNALVGFQKSFNPSRADLINSTRFRGVLAYDAVDFDSKWIAQPMLGAQLYSNRGSSTSQAFISSQSSTLLGGRVGYKFETGIELSATGLIALAHSYSHYELAVEAQTKVNDRFDIGLQLSREDVEQTSADLQVVSVRSLLFLKFKFGSAKETSVSGESSQKGDLK